MMIKMEDPLHEVVLFSLVVLGIKRVWAVCVRCPVQWKNGCFSIASRRFEYLCNVSMILMSKLRTLANV